ncbi:histidine-type phosphatase [Erwinia sorbitola]|uniref:Histidine-type phosphatase n=1 Tax=Erwinia sorbitola TaxID=2681984 RepID=A0ABW9RAR5_9GAMM|nr:histidine-type phosphatase [Erwinia sorbitola]MTD27142.1 histidine-type phosphatase [Erwinia sorbitola]
MKKSTRHLYFAALFGVITFSVQAAPHYVLEKVVEVSRHGVRPPTAGNRKEMETGSGRPWASWLTADGQLTGHGYSAAWLKGQYEGNNYRQSGLIGAGCPTPREIFVWASPLQRTRATAEALTDGAFPGCGIPIHHSAEKNDPLFQNQGPGIATLDEETQRKGALAALGGSLSAAQKRLQPEISLLKQAVCLPGAPCPVFDQPWKIKFASDGRIMITGLDTLAAMAETLRLEWSDNKPLNQVAFGHATSAAQIGKLMPLLTIKYDATNDQPYVARRGGSLLMDQIAKALQQGVTVRPLQDAPPDTRWLLFVAHDVNIAFLRTLLNFSWQQGEYPRGTVQPAGSLVFERWQEIQSGKRFIRILFRGQSLDQIRLLTPVSDQHPLLESELTFSGCEKTDVGTLCPYDSALARLRQHIDPSLIQPVSYQDQLATSRETP